MASGVGQRGVRGAHGSVRPVAAVDARVAGPLWRTGTVRPTPLSGGCAGPAGTLSAASA